MSSPISKKTLVVITGASRGIGRACAVAFAKDTRFSNSDLTLSLLARGQDGLTRTVELVREAASANHSRIREEEEDSSKGGEITVYTNCVDLNNLDTLETDIQSVFQECASSIKSSLSSSMSCYDRTIFINNAGSTGYLGPIASSSFPSPREIQATLDLNVTSTLWLSSYFIRYFASNDQGTNLSSSSSLSSSPNVSSCTVVNMSSLCAIEPFPTMSVYCTGKAARDMFHKTLAKEVEVEVTKDNSIDVGGLESPESQKDTNITRILNYAPGAIETAMTDELSSSNTLDSDISDYFKKMKDESTLIQPHQTAERLVNLIAEDKFVNGDHVDYWDLEPASTTTTPTED